MKGVILAREAATTKVEAHNLAEAPTMRGPRSRIGRCLALLALLLMVCPVLMACPGRGQPPASHPDGRLYGSTPPSFQERRREDPSAEQARIEMPGQGGEVRNPQGSTNPNGGTQLEGQGNDARIEGDLGSTTDDNTSLTEHGGEEVGNSVVLVLLPLSGRGEAVGRQAMLGLELAAGDTRVSAAPTFVVRDTAGDPQRAVRAITELMKERPVRAIIGPLSTKVAAAVLAHVEPQQIPVLNLSPGPPATGRGKGSEASVPTSEPRSLLPNTASRNAGSWHHNPPHAFRVCVTPEGEIEHLLRAAQAQGLRRIAVAVPSSTLGQNMLGYASVAAGRVGLRWHEVVRYPPNARSLRAPLEALARAKSDGVLVLDGAPMIRLMAPGLASLGYGGKLLIPSIGFDLQKLADVARHLDGAIASAPFLPETLPENGLAFLDAFMDAFGEKPNLYAAMGHDAAMILLQTHAEVMHRHPRPQAMRLEEWQRAFRETLRGQAFRTVGPTGGFQDNGEARSGTRLTTNREGQWEVYDDAF